MKCAGSSIPPMHSLHTGSFGVIPGSLRALKRLASASRPSHPTRRRIWKLLILVRFGRPRVTVQWGTGFPRGNMQSDRWRCEHSSRKEEYSIDLHKFPTHLLHAFLLQEPSIMEGREGRSRDSNNVQKIEREPFIGEPENLFSRTSRGRESAGRLAKERTKFSYRCCIRDVMLEKPIKCNRALE